MQLKGLYRLKSNIDDELAAVLIFFILFELVSSENKENLILNSVNLPISAKDLTNKDLLELFNLVVAVITSTISAIERQTTTRTRKVNICKFTHKS